MIGRVERFVVRRLLRRTCPDVVPRSGEKGRRVKCYTIYLKTGPEDWLLLVDGINETGFVGRKWTGNQFDKPDVVSFSQTNGVSIEIERIIGLFSFTYSSAVQCALYDWSRVNRLPIISEALTQFFFSRRDLGLTHRIETLRLLVQASAEDEQFGVDEISLPSLLHGPRWILHPDKTRQQNYARLLLASFANSGEVTKTENGIYRITGKALTTLSTYETETRRHDQMLAQSRHMKWLTFALIVVGLIGALATYLAAGAT